MKITDIDDDDILGPANPSPPGRRRRFCGHWVHCVGAHPL